MSTNIAGRMKNKLFDGSEMFDFETVFSFSSVIVLLGEQTEAPLANETVDVSWKNGDEDEDNEVGKPLCSGSCHDTANDEKSLPLGSLISPLDFHTVFAVPIFFRPGVNVGMQAHASAERTKRTENLSETARAARKAVKTFKNVTLFILDKLQLYYRVMVAIAVNMYVCIVNYGLWELQKR